MLVKKPGSGELSRSSWIEMIGLGILNPGASLTSWTRIVNVCSIERLTSGIPARSPEAGPLSTATTRTRIGPEFRRLTSGARS